MRLKYQASIEDVDDCPPQRAVSVACKAFRFVHSDLNHQNNNLPTAMIDPSVYPPGHSMHCHSWALSLFSSQELAEKKYKKCISARPLVAQRVGTHLASGDIKESDGKIMPAGASGHFSLFESDSFDFHERFEMIGIIDCA